MGLDVNGERLAVWKGTDILKIVAGNKETLERRKHREHFYYP